MSIYRQMAESRLGSIYTDLILNAVYRGVFGTPPSVMYVALGSGATGDSVTEIAGVRAAVPLTRGMLSAADVLYSADPTYGTSGTYAFRLQEDVRLYIDSGVPDTSATFIMMFDALSGGNRLMWSPITPFNVVGGDVIRLPRGNAIATLNRTILPGFQVYDWLFRGLPLSDYWNTTNFPAMYFGISRYADGTLGMCGNVRLAVPRSPASWSAPVAASFPETRKITNLVDMNFGASTAYYPPFTYMGWSAYMFPSVQTFNDEFASGILNGMPSVTLQVGDSIRFPANNFEIILG